MDTPEKQGDVCKESLFNELFREHSGNLYKFLFYKYGAGNNPSDVVQEAFLKLWDHCKKVTVEKARGFLYTVANNLMLGNLAKNKTAQKYETESTEQYSYQTPHFELEGKEYKEQLDQAIGSLTEEQRVALLLNRIEGKKHREIAEMLDISQKAVEKRIYTAIAKIREQVDFFK